METKDRVETALIVIATFQSCFLRNPMKKSITFIILVPILTGIGILVGGYAKSALIALALISSIAALYFSRKE